MHIYVDNKFYNEAYTSLYAGFNAVILHVYNSKELNWVSLWLESMCVIGLAIRVLFEILTGTREWVEFKVDE